MANERERKVFHNQKQFCCNHKGFNNANLIFFLLDVDFFSFSFLFHSNHEKGEMKGLLSRYKKVLTHFDSSSSGLWNATTLLLFFRSTEFHFIKFLAFVWNNDFWIVSLSSWIFFASYFFSRVFFHLNLRRRCQKSLMRMRL